MKRVHIFKGQLRPVIWDPQTRDEMSCPGQGPQNVEHSCSDVRECWSTMNEHSNIEPIFWPLSSCLDERMEHGQVEPQPLRATCPWFRENDRTRKGFFSSSRWPLIRKTWIKYSNLSSKPRFYEILRFRKISKKIHMQNIFRIFLKWRFQ